MHTMVLLRDEAQLDARFGSFGDSAILNARYVHCFLLNILKNHFGHTR
jgi:hypothetical protein